MNKAQLTDAVARDAGISKSQAQRVINSLIKHIQKALEKDEKVTLVGFGTFSTRKRAARSGRNPSTGKAITVPAKRIVKFSKGNDLGKLSRLYS